MQEPTCKTCSMCGERKPLHEFHRNNASRDGRVVHCKPCRRRSRQEQYAIADPEQLEKARKIARQNARKRREEDPDGARERAAAWQAKNRERYLETRAARLPRYAEYNTEYHRRYRELNREQIAEYKRRRRALKAGSSVDDVDLDALWTGLCALCAEAMDRTLRHPDPLSPSVDHIVPLAMGGTHEQSNIQWTHLVCNLRKGARLTD